MHTVPSTDRFDKNSTDTYKMPTNCPRGHGNVNEEFVHRHSRVFLDSVLVKTLYELTPFRMSHSLVDSNNSKQRSYVQLCVLLSLVSNYPLFNQQHSHKLNTRIGPHLMYTHTHGMLHKLVLPLFLNIRIFYWI